MRLLPPLVPFLGLCACTAGTDDTSDTSASVPCEWTTSSTLAGATVEAGEADCDWRLADADAGVDLPWTLVVTEAHEVDVDMVGCEPVDASHLRFEEYVSADPAGQSADTWCPRCDTGLCPEDPDTYTTVAGTYPGTFTWRPRQWSGPSDYGAQPGELFPAGAYTIVIRAAGTLVADGTPWEVRASAPLTLRE